MPARIKRTITRVLIPVLDAAGVELVEEVGVGVGVEEEITEGALKRNV